MLPKNNSVLASQESHYDIFLETITTPKYLVETHAQTLKGIQPNQIIERLTYNASICIIPTNLLYRMSDSCLNYIIHTHIHARIHAYFIWKRKERATKPIAFSWRARVWERAEGTRERRYQSVKNPRNFECCVGFFYVVPRWPRSATSCTGRRYHGLYGCIFIAFPFFVPFLGISAYLSVFVQGGIKCR